MEHLESAGVHVHPVPGEEEVLDLGAVLRACREVGIRSIFCEGGRTLADSLLRERRVHRFYLVVAPKTFGAAGMPAFGDESGALDWSSYRVAHVPQALGQDTLIVLDRQED